jgi:hypothetical protein
VSGITFDQVDWFGSQAPPVANSEWGVFAADITPDTSEFYVNVLASTGGPDTWVVRNLPTLPSTLDPATQRFSTVFDLGLLGLSRGTDLTSLDYLVTIDPAPRTTPPPSGSMTTISVGDIIIDAEGRDLGDVLTEPGQPADLSSLDFTVLVTDFQWEPVMPNLDLDNATNPGDLNGCGPAAAANSLKWLGAPDPLRTIFNDISSDMGRGAGQPVGDGQFIDGKLKYVKDEALGIEVKFQDNGLGGSNRKTTNGTAVAKGTKPTFEFLRRELEQGEDVEIGMTFFRCTRCVSDGNGDGTTDIDAGNKCKVNGDCDAVSNGDGAGLCRAIGPQCVVDSDCNSGSSRCAASGGHWVTATGSLDLGLVQGVWTNDDGNQSAAGGLRTSNFSWIKIRKDGFMELSGFPRNQVDIVVSESPRFIIPPTLELTPIDPFQMELVWSPSTCPSPPFFVDYGIYQGNLSSFPAYSHQQIDCFDDFNDLQEVIPIPPGNTYYLVVPRGEEVEGSYGSASHNPERPPGMATCVPGYDPISCP